MISHGLISAALFLCFGVVYDRLHSRLISTYGGLVNYLQSIHFIFSICSVRLPERVGSWVNF